MYNFLKDNENRVKTLLGSSLTDQYWDKFLTSISGSMPQIQYTDSQRVTASLYLNQYESNNDVSWFVNITGSLEEL